MCKKLQMIENEFCINVDKYLLNILPKKSLNQIIYLKIKVAMIIIFQMPPLDAINMYERLCNFIYRAGFF